MSGLAPFLLWLKAFHIVFVVTWFAGLFYLPRLFVYHAVSSDPISIQRFKIMERRLYVLMSMGALLAALFGVLMLLAAPAYLQMGWLHAKLFLVLLLVGYHLLCNQLRKAFAEDRNQRSQGWYRWFNEAPSVLLIGIVVLAVVKPF